ncbi:hypothetical protein SEA_TEACUP_82 [Arthrobacter phage Teacup]|uniref:Uncharacterized protein n=1 Tax=Arthrobacter phage Teacup TaxID=2015871 RepID=A0A222ZI01_9CAUD|nr:hypothetical protein QCN31_gp82 [Arthrobacter phage Teacup]ASR84088.1 hypothetical protein SEA_TEACUP_82 [Arthrobacter phage Teacup]
MTFSMPHTVCTPAEYAALKELYPRLVEGLGDYLIPRLDIFSYENALPLVFVFMGTEKQRKFWMRDKDLNPKHVRLVTEPAYLQGLRARAVPVRVDPYWTPLGIDERVDYAASKWYLEDMESKVGSLWDIRNQENPIPENDRWIRLA